MMDVIHVSGVCFRIEKAMQAIQNLWPVGFTIEQLDEELQCMALVHALPDEFCHLASTLLLVDKLDKAMTLQAFRSKELNRQCNAELVNKARAFGKGASIADITCYFCKKKGHTTHNCAALIGEGKVSWGCQKGRRREDSSCHSICWSGKCCWWLWS